MKTLFKTLLVLGLLLVVGSVVLGVSVISVLGDTPGVHLTINGDDVGWSRLDIADAIGAGFGLVVAIGVMCLVLPLVLLLGLGLPLLILGGLLLAGIAAVLGVGAVLGSPLILLVVVVWLLVRDKPSRRRAVPPSPAAPAGSDPTFTG